MCDTPEENRTHDIDMEEALSVVLVGGAIAGMVLAKALSHEFRHTDFRIRCTIVERDASLSDVRPHTRSNVPNYERYARMFVMPFQEGKSMWQLSFPCELEEAERAQEVHHSLKELAIERCGRWHASIPALLHATRPDMATGFPVFDHSAPTPENLRHLLRSPHVKLAGDAAHCMSPFKGQGANQAILDASSLAKCLHTNLHMHRASAQDSISPECPLSESVTCAIFAIRGGDVRASACQSSWLEGSRRHLAQPDILGLEFPLEPERSRC